MSSLITGNQATFPEVIVEASHPNHATLQGFTTAIYEVGCLFGALSNLWVGDKLGCRRTIALGGSIMMIGGRTGLITSTVPTYHAELSPSAKRGRMIMMEGTLIVAGVAIAYWIDLALFFVNWSSAQWRVPISLQLVFEIIVVTCIGFIRFGTLPDQNPRLVKHGRNAEAMAVISTVEDKSPSDPEVQHTYYGIREAVAITGGRSQNFRRTVIAVLRCTLYHHVIYCGNTDITQTILFQRLGLSDVNARITAAANGTEYFLASFIAYYAIDYVGRRQLMLIGAIGQSLVMLLLAILGYINIGPAQIVSVVLLFGFNTFFAIGWLGMAWLYCDELAGLRTRAQANALSTGRTRYSTPGVRTASGDKERVELMAAIYDKPLKRQDYSGIVDKDKAKEAADKRRESSLLRIRMRMTPRLAQMSERLSIFWYETLPRTVDGKPYGGVSVVDDDATWC
ncbi:uncharacterized protein HD556DRAFT_1313325 [Suillus plorans]|uniref:Major facilitator superfamily (MFS) profile domain-containing protein n=1 Tax=Suillus plorans TaxID=116603 RepID=A0A9P7ACL5_9AGAM|nr:uncharacterized protein HD556DRAFT_1313325 [Suillus plorans]KAG1786702.1 hypothetical protein HD556DRAFT_1313325 [Suillus plorans]